jgi:hypothetical protein
VSKLEVRCCGGKVPLAVVFGVDRYLTTVTADRARIEQVTRLPRCREPLW